MPFLPLVYATLRQLPVEIEWTWSVIEGTALPRHCTRWVADIQRGLSADGTTQFLRELSHFDSRVHHQERDEWNGKIEMVNASLSAPRKDDILLWQIDHDEIWDAEQIVNCWSMFNQNPKKNAAFFWCNYFVGPDKVIITRNCFGNHPEYEWVRVWKIRPGMLFKTHEPPVIEGLKLNPFTHAETEARGLVFDHHSWCTRAQVEMKANYYAGPNNPNAKHYAGLVERWEQFQNEKTWPRPLKQLFPWVEPWCMVNKI